MPSSSLQGNPSDPETSDTSSASNDSKIEERWYAIKRILNERPRESHGDTEYLVEWEPFEGTKEEPDWLPENAVTDDAIRKWKRVQSPRRLTNRSVSSVTPSTRANLPRQAQRKSRHETQESFTRNSLDKSLPASSSADSLSTEVAPQSGGGRSVLQAADELAIITPQLSSAFSEFQQEGASKAASPSSFQSLSQHPPLPHDDHCVITDSQGQEQETSSLALSLRQPSSSLPLPITSRTSLQGGRSQSLSDRVEIQEPLQTDLQLPSYQPENLSLENENSLRALTEDQNDRPEVVSSQSSRIETSAVEVTGKVDSESRKVPKDFSHSQKRILDSLNDQGQGDKNRRIRLQPKALEKRSKSETEDHPTLATTKGGVVSSLAPLSQHLPKIRKESEHLTGKEVSQVSGAIGNFLQAGVSETISRYTDSQKSQTLSSSGTTLKRNLSSWLPGSEALSSGADAIGTNHSREAREPVIEVVPNKLQVSQETQLGTNKAAVIEANRSTNISQNGSGNRTEIPEGAQQIERGPFSVNYHEAHPSSSTEDKAEEVNGEKRQDKTDQFAPISKNDTASAGLIMEEAGPDEPLSAVEELRRMQEQAYSEPFQDEPLLTSSGPQPMELGPTTISPADIMPPTAADQAASFLTQSEGSDMPEPAMSAMSRLQHHNPMNLVLGTRNHSPPQDTVHPTDIDSSMSLGAIDVVPQTQSGASASSSTPNDFEPSVLSHDGPDEAIIPHEYIITLPFQSSRRSVYLQTHRDHAELLKDTDRLASNNVPGNLDVSRREEIEAIQVDLHGFFLKLLDICDLPDMTESLLTMDAISQKKHCVQTNCKFSFIHELILCIQNLQRTILIICREGPVFDLLCALVETSGCKFIIHEEKMALDEGQDPILVLASSSQDRDGIPANLHCVIEFDSSCRESELARQIRLSRNADSRSPIFLTLMVSYSLEHFQHKLDNFLPDSLEDKWVRLSGTAVGLHNLVPLVRDPPPGYPEPPDLGFTFASLLRSPTTGIDWNPTSLPADVFDVFGSQVASATQNSTLESSAATSTTGRKRQLDDVAHDPSKRVKRPMGDGGVDTQSRFDFLGAEYDKQKVALKKTSESLIFYRKQCAELRGQLVDCTRTIKKTSRQYHAALQDRSLFDNSAKKSQEAKRAAEEALTNEKLRCARLETEIELLKTKKAEMQQLMEGSANVEVAQLAQLEARVVELEERTRKAEKSAEHARTDLEFARDQYQNASRTASQLDNKTRELEARAARLEHQAGENLRNIHKQNASIQGKHLLRQLQEKDAMIRNREFVIRRLEDEVAALRNGRRETRQSSVPRSPRLGMAALHSSASGGRAGGVQHTSGRTIPGGSRGTSPMPARITGFNSQSSARWQYPSRLSD